LIDRLPTGQIVRAEVIRLLSENLLTLSVPGGSIQAKTDVPVSAGDKLLLEVSRDSQGAASLRLVSRDSISTEPTTPATVAKTGAAGPGALAGDGLADSKLAGLTRAGGAIEQLVRSRPDLAPRIEQLLQQSDQRPTSLGEGIVRLQQDVAQIAQSVPRSTGVSLDPLTAIAGRAVSQLIGEASLADPPSLAATFLNRVVELAQGLESKLARVADPILSATTLTDPRAVTSATAPGQAPTGLPATQAVTAVGSTVGNGAGSPSLPVAAESARAEDLLLKSLPSLDKSVEASPGVIRAAVVSQLAEIAGDAAKSSPNLVVGAGEGKGARAESAPANGDSAAVPSRVDSGASLSTTTAKLDGVAEGNAATTVRGVLDGDLKWQLLELRGKLEAVAQEAPSPTVTASIARTDRLIEQLTSQQLRNVDGLNQYLSVALPIDPKTGVSQAQLQAFYRRSPGGGAPSLDETSRFTVALFLQMTQLGDVLATVTGVEGTVSVSLTAENAEATDRLTRSLDELRSGLGEMGHASAMITVRQRPAVSEVEGDTGGAGTEGLWGDFVEQVPMAVVAGQRLNREA
jgi:hypothetical protein